MARLISFCAGWLVVVSFCARTMLGATWDGSDSVNWSDANNWDVAPVAGDALVFSATGQAFQPLNNDIVGGSYSSITFDADVFTNDTTGPNTHVAITGNSFQLGAAGITASAIGAGRTVEIQTGIDLLATATINNTTAGTTLLLSGPISGASFGITKTGAGTLRLTGTNTFTGKTTISQGFLEVDTLTDLGVPGPLGAPTVAASTGEISLGGTFRFTGSTDQATNRNIRSASNNARLDASGTNGAVATFTGTLFRGDFTTHLTGTGIGVFNGVISSPNNSSFQKSGTGTWILGGAANNDFRHNLSVVAGTLIAAKNNAFGTTNLSGGPFNVLVSSGATVGIQGNINYTQTAKGIRLTGNGDAGNGRSGALDNVSGNNTLSAPIVLTGSARIGATAGTLILNGTLSNAGFLLTFAGDGNIGKTTNGITGTGGLTKTGNGKLTLSSVNTYSGLTTIQQGELELTGSINDSGVVLAGGILSGTGSMGSLVVEAGGVLSPGLSPGELSVLGNAVFDDDGEYHWEINDWNGTIVTNYDTLDITGSLAFTSSIADPFVISVNSLDEFNVPNPVENFGEGDRQWIIASAAGGISGLTSSNVQLDFSGFLNTFKGEFSLEVQGNDLVLVYSAPPIPEPGSLSLLACGGALLLWRSRRGVMPPRRRHA